jgi:hypothetical protein
MSYTFEQDMDRSFMLGRLKGALDIAIGSIEKVTDPDCSDYMREFERDTTLKVLQELQAEVEEVDKKVKKELDIA